MAGAVPAATKRAAAPAYAFGAFVLALFVAQPAQGQRVRLEIRPQVGDTIQMQLDQEIEMTGTSPDGTGMTARPMTGTMRVRTRAIPLRRIESGTVVLAITDSVVMSPMGEWRLPESSRRALQGKRVELRVSFNGAMDLIDTGEHEGDTPPFLGPMPAMLPTGTVRVGATWTRRLSVPLGRTPSGAASVDARFRLDSLSENGDIAYITMQGTLSRNGDRDGARAQRSTGTLAGNLQLDRRLGWITDTRLVLSMRTVIPMADSTARARPASTQVQMKVTQRLRATRGQ